jgi:hypothetical protein
MMRRTWYRRLARISLSIVISGTRRSPLVREFADRAASLYLLFITYLGPTGGGRTVVERNAEYDECEHQRRLQ